MPKIERGIFEATGCIKKRLEWGGNKKAPAKGA